MSRILQKTSHWLKKAGRGLTNLYRGPWYKKTVVWIITCVLSVILLLIAVDLNFLYLFGKSPGFKDIEHPVTSEASEIYSADSVLIGRFFSENRTPVEYEDISPIIIQTLIDTEDERFYRHHGIDFQGLFAAVKDIASGRARGASTITQQLAKNLFRVRTQYSTGLLGKIPGVKILVMKAKEWIVAVKLEMIFSKEEILTMYFNTVDFGSNSFGIKTACRTYFNTTPDQLTYEQAATLVGLLKATSSYNPKLNPKNSTKRRNVVLTNLYDHGHLVIHGHKATRAQLDSLMTLPMIVNPRKEESSYDGIAPYFRAVLPEYIDMLCEKGVIAGVDEENKPDLYADGLKIYTTLDTRMQKYAEEAAIQQMEVLQQRFKQHWGNTNPWQDERHQEIPNFIEDLAKKTTAYKYLETRFPDGLHRLLSESAPQGQGVQLRRSERRRDEHHGLHPLYGQIPALRFRSHRTGQPPCQGMGGRHRLRLVEIRQSHRHAPTRFNLQTLCICRSDEPRTDPLRHPDRRMATIPGHRRRQTYQMDSP